MDWGSQGSAEVRRAWCDVAELGIVRESRNSLYLSGSRSQSPKYSSDVSTILHWDNPELILFINPNKESLIVIVEDSSALWPVSIQATSIKESISFLKEEMISNQLIPLIFSKWVEGVILSSKFTSKAIASQNDLLFNRVSLLPCNCWTQWEVS